MGRRPIQPTYMISKRFEHVSTSSPVEFPQSSSLWVACLQCHFSRHFRHFSIGANGSSFIS